MKIEQTDEEKALHFASIGMMDYASFYATRVLIQEIKHLRESLSSNRDCE
jgi:hypothetical protein